MKLNAIQQLLYACDMANDALSNSRGPISPIEASRALVKAMMPIQAWLDQKQEQKREFDEYLKFLELEEISGQ